MRLPASVGEFAIIMVCMVGIVTTAVIAGYSVLYAVKTLLNVGYMTVLTHLIVGWIGATVGILLGEQTEDNS